MSYNFVHTLLSYNYTLMTVGSETIFADINILSLWMLLICKDTNELKYMAAESLFAK